MYRIESPNCLKNNKVVKKYIWKIPTLLRISIVQILWWLVKIKYPNNQVMLYVKTMTYHIPDICMGKQKGPPEFSSVSRIRSNSLTCCQFLYHWSNQKQYTFWKSNDRTFQICTYFIYATLFWFFNFFLKISPGNMISTVNIFNIFLHW